MICARCHGQRWICEAHPWKPVPHDACSGPGEPCPECQGDGRPELPDRLGVDRIDVDAPHSTGPRREHVWSLRKNGKQVDCELRFHGESYGWECQCLRDGELEYGRRFVLREHVLAEAEGQRQRLMREGWTNPLANRPD